MSKRRPPPLLPRAQLLDAINSNPAPKSTRKHPSAIFDGHLHLWASPEIIEKLDWAFESKEAEQATRAVRSDHGASRYMQSIKNLQEKGKARHTGATYVQIESRHAPGQWEHALREIEWLVALRVVDATAV
jgi:hypothetical protein